MNNQRPGILMLKWKPLDGFHSVLSGFISKTGSPFIILVGLELAIFLLQAPQGWDYRYVQQYPDYSII